MSEKQNKTVICPVFILTLNTSLDCSVNIFTCFELGNWNFLVFLLMCLLRNIIHSKRNPVLNVRSHLKKKIKKTSQKISYMNRD